jgi:hypothetical protein
MDSPFSKEKDFIVTYRGNSSYAVLGWVRAKTKNEAFKKVKKVLGRKAKERFVSGAQIAEWKGVGTIFFQ